MNLFDRVRALAGCVPRGRATTYGQLARLAGNPRLSRAVGFAMHGAPDSVPCHRVVNRRGELCDAFEPLGRESHRLLLEMEGVPMLPDGRVDLERCLWPREPQEFLLARLLLDFLDVLGDDLRGFYVHGSLAFGCFTWARSDVDFLAVAVRPPSLSQRVALIRALLDRAPEAPPKGIEMSVVLESACRNFVYPTPFELHFSDAWRESAARDPEAFCLSLHGDDPDLAAHFAVTREVGWNLYGPPAKELFAPVPREALLDSIRADVSDEGADPLYRTLNLCRALAYREEGLLLSKAGGVEWALRHAPERHRELLRAALHAYREGGAIPDPADFQRWALARILAS